MEQQVSPMVSTGVATSAVANNSAAAAQHVDQIRAMVRRDTTSWGRGLLMMAAVQLLGSGVLSASWGVLLLVVGGSSFVFQDPAMFVIYAVTLGWAAITNILGGGLIWMGLGAIQVILAIRVFLKGRKYHQALASREPSGPQVEAGPSPVASPTAETLPWVSAVLSLVAISGIVAVFTASIVYSRTYGTGSLPAVYDFALGLAIDLGILGFALGLSAVLSRFPGTVYSVLGMIAGALAMLVQLASHA